jgi:hypothetical protein
MTKPPLPNRSGHDTREARLREALRANLHRRKAQARARQDDQTEDAAAPPAPENE